MIGVAPKKLISIWMGEVEGGNGAYHRITKKNTWNCVTMADLAICTSADWTPIGIEGICFA